MKAQTLDPLWKALADPSRREILDLLRERPRTTGELAETFDFTRFAVMKHLKVLERAQLVTVRREGRVRWNHLNAVPLQVLYERWIRPYEAEWASRLIHLKQMIEGPPAGDRTGGSPMPESTAAQELRSIQIEQEIRLAAPPERVYRALLGDITPWWGRPYVHAAHQVQSIEIEPRLGGHFRERWSEGEGAIWATVTRLKKNQQLMLAGPMAMPGAVHGVMNFLLEPDGDQTVLKFSHHAIGQIAEETAAGYDMGWKDLLGTRLRAWVENEQRLGLGHEPAE